MNKNIVLATIGATFIAAASAAGSDYGCTESTCSYGSYSNYCCGYYSYYGTEYNNICEPKGYCDGYSNCIFECGDGSGSGSGSGNDLGLPTCDEGCDDDDYCCGTATYQGVSVSNICGLKSYSGQTYEGISWECNATMVNLFGASLVALLALFY